MTPKPPPGFELIDAPQAQQQPAPPPGFEIIGDEADAEAAQPKRQAEVRAYEPTWREWIGGYLSDILGNTAEGDRLVSGTVGSTGLGHSRISVSDFTPARIPMYAQEAKRAAEQGHLGEAALSGFAALPVPVAGTVLDTAVNTVKPVIDAAGRATTAAKARLPSALTGSSADDVANQVLANRLQRSGQSADTVAEDIAAGHRSARLDSNSNAVLPEMLADTSDDMQRLTGSVYRTGGEASEIVKPALEGRQRGPANPYAPRLEDGPQGQVERIIDDFDRALGVKSSKGARATSQELEAAQKVKADELYAKARKTSEAFDLDPVNTAWQLKAQQYQGPFRDKLVSAINLFSRPKGSFTRWDVDTVERFDNAKKVLDDLIENSKAEFGKATNLTRELTSYKNDLLAKVHEGGKNKFYQQARDEFGSAAENREAIELGRKAFREDSEVSVDTYRALSPAQQKLFRIGLRDALRLKLATKKPGDNATLPLQERRIRELLTEVIPKPKAKAAEFADRPERFGDLMRREERMSQTRNAVLGNSATAQRHADDAQFASDAISRILTSGRSVANFALETVAGVAQKVFGYRQDVAAALARKLVTSNPAERQALLEEIRSVQTPERFSAFSEGLGQFAAPPASGAATITGPAAPPENRSGPFPPPMYLGGPKPTDGEEKPPRVPFMGPEIDPLLDEMYAKSEQDYKDRALLKYRGEVVVPGTRELVKGAADMIGTAAEGMLAFGPMGEALDAPLHGIGAAIRYFKPAPAPKVNHQETIDFLKDMRRTLQEAFEKAEAEKVLAHQNNLKAQGLSGSGVPITANKRKVIEFLDETPAGRNIPGEPGLRPMNEQRQVIQKSGSIPLHEGPWGVDMARSLQNALNRAGELRKAAQSKAGKAGKPRAEPAANPSSSELGRAYQDLRREASSLREQLETLKSSKSISDGVRRSLHDKLKAAQEELVRLQKQIKDGE